MRKKLFITIWGFLFVSQAAFASSLTLSHYPTNSETKKLLKSSVTELTIESFYNPGHVTSRVGYPGKSDLKNINKLSSMDITVNLDAGSYPSTNAAKRINDMDDHITLTMMINQCLTSNRVEKRLGKITKKAHVTIYCPTKKSFEEAEVRLDDIVTNNTMPNLTIDLKIVPSYFPF